VYIGNTYGAGTGFSCRNNFDCNGTETSLEDCSFIIDSHKDPSQDVSIACYGMISVVSVILKTTISIAHLRSSIICNDPVIWCWMNGGVTPWLCDCARPCSV